MRNYPECAGAFRRRCCRPAGYIAIKFKAPTVAPCMPWCVPATAGHHCCWMLEKRPRQQEVTANLLAGKTAQKDGSFSRSISDTNKAVIKPDSQPIVKQIAELMQSQPSLQVSIEDIPTIRASAANKTLCWIAPRKSEAPRQGIKPGRMATAGIKREKPVTDNRTEEGRAKNRRVELVRK